jgi:hypothetical protein
VSRLGQLATGSLFSLGLRDETLHSIQNVNRVVALESLEQAAGHLVTEVVDRTTTTYDPERQQLVAQVDRILGGVVLRSYFGPVDAAHGSPESEKISEGHREHVWNSWTERKSVQVAYDLASVGEAIENPEYAMYGIDPITGEELLAWKGGNGQWCRSKEIAVKSLEARQARLLNAPKKAELRELKTAIRKASAELTGLKRRQGGTAAEVTELLSRRKKMDKQDWLSEAQRLLQSVNAS